MGGNLVEVERGAAPRVVICLADRSLEVVLTAALEDVGFEPQSGDPRGLLAHADGDRPVVIIDDRWPGWLRTTIDLVQRRPDVRPVVLADVQNPDEFLAALSGGVCGFCRPDSSVEAIVRTVQSVRDSGVAIPRDMVGSLVDQVRHGRGHRMNTVAGPIDVTDREWQIMQLMLQRRTTREIAEALFVSNGTVRSHVSALMHKVGAVDRDDLIAMVQRVAR